MSDIEPDTKGGFTSSYEPASDTKGFTSSYEPSPYGDSSKDIKSFDRERGSVDGFHGAVAEDGTIDVAAGDITDDMQLDTA